jgi:hypothetical protein
VLTEFAAGLPVLRVPLTRQLRSLLGLRRKGTTVKSDSVPSYSLGTIGNISSRGRRQDLNLKGDSVEDLILNNAGGIKVTTGFSIRVEKKPSKDSEAVRDFTRSLEIFKAKIIIARIYTLYRILQSPVYPN